MGRARVDLVTMELGASHGVVPQHCSSRSEPYAKLVLASDLKYSTNHKVNQKFLNLFDLLQGTNCSGLSRECRTLPSAARREQQV